MNGNHTNIILIFPHEIFFDFQLKRPGWRNIIAAEQLVHCSIFLYFYSSPLE